jgi:hypothetical protein
MRRRADQVPADAGGGSSCTFLEDERASTADVHINTLFGRKEG